MLLQSLAYYYDAVGNIVSTHDTATQSVYFSATVPSADQDFTYDAVYRLIAAEGREHAAVDGVSEAQDLTHDGYNIVNAENPSELRRYTQDWVYDVIGNILSMSHAPDSPGTSWSRDYSYVTDTNLLEETDAGTVLTYTHDEHGNMVDMPHLAALDYDFADQLRHVEIASDQHVYFVCDASGQRVRKVWITNSGNLRRERIYLGGYEVWRRYNKVGGDWVLDDERETLHVADDARRVCMIESLTWKDEVVIDDEDVEPRFRFQLDNHLGTACVETDENGSVITYEEYHPYGTSAYRAFKSGVEVSAKRYRYTGKERDEETSLYYHGARYYSAWLGRWTQADPAGLVDGSGLFNYCRGSPVVMSDPSGTSSIVNYNEQPDGPIIPPEKERARELKQDPSGAAPPDVDALPSKPGDPAAPGAKIEPPPGGGAAPVGGKAASGPAAPPTPTTPDVGPQLPPKAEGGYYIEDDSLSMGFIRHADTGIKVSLGFAAVAGTVALGIIAFSALATGAAAAAAAEATAVGTAAKVAAVGGVASIASQIGQVYGPHVLGMISQHLSRAADIAQRHAQQLDPRAGDIVNMAGKDVDIATQTISQLPGNLFEPLKCTDCVNAMRDALQAQGIRGEVLNIYAEGGADYIVNDLVGGGTTITQNGFHQAIRVGDMVFDNWLRQGVPYDDYVRSLKAFYGIRISVQAF